MSAEKPNKPHEVCGAKTKSGTPCKQVAGTRTDHPGTGRCWVHGGKTPIKTGRYSKVTRHRIAELLAEFEGDPDPLNLLPEVSLLRALVLDFIERYTDFSAALIAWHQDNASWTDAHGNEHESRKPVQVVDILSVGKFVGEIGSLVDKVQKAKKEGTITIATLDRVIEQHGVELMKAAQEAIPDAAQREALFRAVEQRWGSITLDVASPPGPKAGA